MTFLKSTIAAVTLVSTLSSVTAFAADGSSGCGVGWFVFKNNTLVSSFLRAVTNQALGNTFSMTSGTSNCAKHSIVYNELRGLHFVEANADSLEIAIASGEGQFLQGFAETMGCNQSSMSEFASTLQSGYTEIYSTETSQAPVDSAAVFSRIKNVLQRNDVLRQQCGNIQAQS